MKRRGAVAALVLALIAGGALSATAASPSEPFDIRAHELHLDMLEPPRPEFQPGVQQIPPDGRIVKGTGGGGMYRTGFEAGEPTLAVTEDGSVLFQALAAAPTVIRSDDGGKSWTDVSPTINGRKTHATSLDPYLYRDPYAGRVFTYDFLFGCSLISFTDDEGATWTTSALQCGEQDHQNLFTAPPVSSPTVGYESLVYACSTQAGATIYSVATHCQKSLDGGFSWVTTGAPPYTTEDHEENDLGVRGYCHGAIGHGFGGPDGTIYIPKGLCGQPWLAISKDEGLSWDRVRVADKGMALHATGVYEHEASVAADAQGNVYYFWIARDRLPYLTVSKNGGRTWGHPHMVGPRALKEAALPSLALGAPGKVAVVYMGSADSPGAPFHESDDCTPDPVSCFSELFFLNPADPEEYEDVTWNGYITSTANALDRRPRFSNATINPPSDPLVRGTCGPIRCKAVYDFLDVVIDHTGRVFASFVDACLNVCAKEGPSNSGNEGVLGVLLKGPRLR
ncbi:MAG TPA: sialidase family protein [Actinomycetota bacterium]|nr:sialidase family protein [Actinomycetota bacterium]